MTNHEQDIENLKAQRDYFYRQLSSILSGRPWKLISFFIKIKNFFKPQNSFSINDLQFLNDNHSEFLNLKSKIVNRKSDIVNRKLSLVVLSYNLLNKTTKPCLESILSAKTNIDFEVIVVDNFSKDGTRKYLKKLKSEQNNLKLIFNKQNFGFAKGNNIGIEAATGDYVVLLNSDTIVTDFWLDKLVFFLEEHPEFGMCGPMTNSSGNEQKTEVKKSKGQQDVKRSISQKVNNKNNIQLSVPDSLNNTMGKEQQNEANFKVTNMLEFFCVAIRKQVFDEIGLLDESYGMGMFEDDDFCLRAYNEGFKLGIVRDCFIYHHGGLSFDKLMTDEQRNKTFYENLSKFEQKFNVIWKPRGKGG